MKNTAEKGGVFVLRLCASEFISIRCSVANVVARGGIEPPITTGTTHSALSVVKLHAVWEPPRLPICSVEHDTEYREPTLHNHRLSFVKAID